MRKVEKFGSWRFRQILNFRKSNFTILLSKNLEIQKIVILDQVYIDSKILDLVKNRKKNIKKRRKTPSIV